MLKQSHILKIKKSISRERPDLSDTFSVLGDKTRYKIIELLSRNKTLCVSDLSAILDVSMSCISQHLRILEMSGLVKSNRQGQSICYSYTNTDPKINAIVDLIFY